MNANRVLRAAMVLAAVLGSAGVALATDSQPEEKGVLRGDLNGNGIHDSQDVDLLAGVLAGKKSSWGLEVLDVDASGRLDANDLAMLKNWAERQAAADAEPRPMRGDVDADGDIDEADALLLMEVYMGLVRAPGGFYAADVDGNGVIEVADLIALTEILYGLREPTHAET